MEQGYTHFYYGDGKGKTTAAFGLALRALGRGLTVTVVQFLKAGDSGECALLSKLGAEIVAGKVTPCFVWDMTEEQKAQTRRLHDGFLDHVSGYRPDVLILDEAGDALQCGLLDEEKLLCLLDKRKGFGETVLTGHQPVPCLMERADYVTEMKSHRHPYEKGVTARKGIEY